MTMIYSNGDFYDLEYVLVDNCQIVSHDNLCILFVISSISILPILALDLEISLFYPYESVRLGL
jgi:hypothetical protein